MENYNELKTFDEACQVLGLDAQSVVPDFSMYPEKHRKSMEAHAKLVLIVEAANKLANGGESWTPDFDDDGEDKWEAWFYKKEVGGSSGFRFRDYGAWLSHSYVGSRLCFISSDVCEYVAKQFIDLYNEYML